MLSCLFSLKAVVLRCKNFSARKSPDADGIAAVTNPALKSEQLTLMVLKCRHDWHVNA